MLRHGIGDFYFSFGKNDIGYLGHVETVIRFRGARGERWREECQALVSVSLCRSGNFLPVGHAGRRHEESRTSE